MEGKEIVGGQGFTSYHRNTWNVCVMGWLGKMHVVLLILFLNVFVPQRHAIVRRNYCLARQLIRVHHCSAPFSRCTRFFHVRTTVFAFLFFSERYLGIGGRQIPVPPRKIHCYYSPSSHRMPLSGGGDPPQSTFTFLAAEQCTFSQHVLLTIGTRHYNMYLDMKTPNTQTLLKKQISTPPSHKIGHHRPKV